MYMMGVVVFFSDGGQLTVMTTYVAIVKVKMKLAKPTVSPATQASLGLEVLRSRLRLKPCGGAD